jgi:ABC-type lipoprotein export system ATPase subunit
MSEARGDNFVMREPEQQAAEQARGTGAKQPAAQPEVNFSSFILSLGSSALFHFGEIPDPVSGAQQRNLDLARQTIDILVVLRDKTTGNLSEEESRLLESLLHDLQMRYVQERKK